MAKSAEAENGRATQHSAKQLAQSACRLDEPTSGKGAGTAASWVDAHGPVPGSTSHPGTDTHDPSPCAGSSLQVVAGVGEVEALVRHGEVRDDRAGQHHRQRGPRHERRVHDLEPRDPAVRGDLDPVRDGPAPPFDEPDTRDLTCLLYTSDAAD